MEIDVLINNFWWPAFVPFFLTMALMLIAMKLFPKLKLMDRPAKYGLKRAAIPYYGGLLIYIAFVVSVLIFLPITGTLIGLLVASSLIVLVGFLDDLLDISPLIRLGVQFLAAVILVFFGIGILSINIPFFGSLDLSENFGGVMIFSALFTIIWVLVIVNSMNFVDGIGGLSSGVTFIGAFTLFLLSIRFGIHEDPQSQIAVATLSMIVAMIALAFLLFDFPKPYILMGDTGSTFFGFMLATLAIFSGGKVATVFLVLGLPILDLIWVVSRRIFRRKKFWKGDLKHLHHRLLQAGISERVVVLLYLLVTAVFAFGAVSFVDTQQKFFIIIALVLLMCLLAGALILLPRRK